MKTTSIHWFLTNFKNIHNIDYPTLRKQLNHISSRKTSKTIITLTFIYCESNLNKLVYENFVNNYKISFHTLWKQFNHIGFQKLQKWSKHWLSYIVKVTQSHWFLKALEIIPTLAFVYCKTDSITLVSKNVWNDPHIGFCILRKQLNHIGFQKTLEMIPTLTFAYYESYSNTLVSHHHLWFIYILFIHNIYDFNQKFKLTS